MIFVEVPVACSPGWEEVGCSMAGDDVDDLKSEYKSVE
jgi:hypothetical protein